RCDDETVLVELELAVARIDVRPVRTSDDEEAITVDREVEGIIGGGQVALGEGLAHRTERAAGAGLLARYRTRKRSRIDVGEDRSASFEAHRIGVGDVVRNDVQGLGGNVEAAQTLLERHDRGSGS